MTYHSVKALNVIRNSPEYEVLKDAIKEKHIRILFCPDTACHDANISVYLAMLILNSSGLSKYKIFINGTVLPQGQLPKEVQDCLNIPEVISLTLQHRVGVPL